VPKNTAGEFAGFVANPNALKRGGKATRAARRRKQRGLLERLAQAEASRFWRAEIDQKTSS